MHTRLISNWVYGGALAGVLLLLLTPVLTAGWPAVLVATFLHLPVYMLHQFEEHDADRFRLFFNATIGRGHEVLSPFAVFVTNVPGVWGVLGVSLSLAAMVNPGWSLIAVYLVLVNTLAHVGPALRARRCNPGLVTALLLFVPLGLTTLWLIHRSGGVAAHYHVIGLGVAIVIHAAILVHVRRQLRRASVGNLR